MQHREDQLRAAFLSASYGTVTERFRLQATPGRPSPLFGAGRPWAILTAHNPDAVQHTPLLNERRQRALEARLQGFPCTPGINGHGRWAEASLIVSGLPLERILSLGREYGQVALLYGVGQRAALVWCRSGRTERRWVAGG
ncbi:DUF3293 domain-containing protein [Deinococcus sp.]|uniref:DUF3293 domain-containing protein n=1 Tax=Deinococcus sp. TaxID=47478 RepID=UPI003C7BA327